MMKYLNNALCAFRKCFRREATFKWFVAVVLGIMVRSDRMGAVTSVIRSLGLAPKYEQINRFFRSDAWDLNCLEYTWQGFVMENAPLVKVDDAVIAVGDGVKVSKEGKRIPAVKRLHQESENSSKPEYINGLMYGGVGVLAENAGKTFCIPLACEVQDGAREIMRWGNKEGVRQGSHVVEMINLAYRSSEQFGKTILLLDRYFLTVPAIKRMHELDEGNGRMSAVIMAKSNAVAYEEPPPRISQARGRPRLKGGTVKLKKLFDEKAEQFQTAYVDMYGKKQKIQYFSIDLLWGQGLYRKHRFVLILMDDGRRAIIASTNTNLAPLAIIALYAKRFSIESTFKAMKQDVAAFTNRFWTHDMPKLKRYAKTNEPDRATQIKLDRARANVRKAFDASEGYVFCGVVALGLLQMLSLIHFSSCSMKQSFRYLRTTSKSAPSEATVADWLRKNIFRLFTTHPDLAISKIILGKMLAESVDFEKNKVS